MCFIMLPQGPVSDGYVFWSEIDGSLTSCIALSFLYDGLIDAGFIPERSAYTLAAMLLSYLTIIVSYIFNVCLFSSSISSQLTSHLAASEHEYTVLWRDFRLVRVVSGAADLPIVHQQVVEGLGLSCCRWHIRGGWSRRHIRKLLHVLSCKRVW